MSFTAAGRKFELRANWPEEAERPLRSAHRQQGREPGFRAPFKGAFRSRDVEVDGDFGCLKVM